MSDEEVPPEEAMWNGLEPEVDAARTPMGRAIMRVLTDRGHYEETPEDFVWATVDAGRAVQFITDRGLTFRNVYDALIDSDSTANPCPCLQADVEQIGALL
jgi:hypothetical protein